MAYDRDMNDRIRDALKALGARGITETSLMGGLVFLQNGNMLCGMDQKHGLMVRVGKNQHEKVLKLKHARPMDFTGRPMKGFVFVEVEGYKTEAALKRWLSYGLAFTGTLPKKVSKKGANDAGKKPRGKSLA